MNLFKNENENVFEKVQEFFKKIDAINCGGCGLAALGLYDAAILEGKNPKIVYLYGWYSSEYNKKEINEQFQRGMSDKAESCMHIVVEIDGVWYDCIGKVNLRVWDCKEFGYVSREHLIKSLITGSWNTWFDRKKWFPKIKEFLGWDNIDIPLEAGSGGYYY